MEIPLYLLVRYQSIWMDDYK